MGHLTDAGMTYFQHMRHAMRISLLLITASLCCMVHSLFPFLFKKTASSIMKHITDNLINRQIQRN